MRSVLVFLRDTTEAAVTAYLDAACPEQREPWVAFVRGDACLYINLYRDGPREHEPEDWADIVKRFSGEPAVGVIADVSGRHPGDEQVAGFVAGLLSRFAGAAMDEYTTHLWSLAELRAGARVEGHPFFDCNGWFAEREQDAEPGAAAARGQIRFHQPKLTGAPRPLSGAFGDGGRGRAMAEEPEITPEQLATFRRCTFARRVFASYPSLWAKTPLGNDDLPPDSRDEAEEWHVSKPYNGEPFDPVEWELRDGGWDHEHCDVCGFKVVDGTAYWPNVEPEAGQVDLCDGCYPRVMSLLAMPQDADS